MVYDTIGSKIKYKRKSLSLTQEDVANALEISVQQYQKYENLVNKIPIHRLIALSKIFKIGVHYFLEENHVCFDTSLKEEKISLEMDDPHLNEVITIFSTIQNPLYRKKALELLKVIASDEQTLLQNKIQTTF
ncbi:MAG: helix-turn-helix transcriptional regulator [Proteobacteria bacterium]|nr:helix-turn-helix transcriptional regulator [Pseudomonadota bacterium]